MDEIDGPRVRAIRQKFHLSAEGFAKVVGVESGRTVRRWEASSRDVPGPVLVLLGLLLECEPARRHLGVETHTQQETRP